MSNVEDCYCQGKPTDQLEGNEFDYQQKIARYIRLEALNDVATVTSIICILPIVISGIIILTETLNSYSTTGGLSPVRLKACIEAIEIYSRLAIFPLLVLAYSKISNTYLPECAGITGSKFYRLVINAKDQGTIDTVNGVDTLICKLRLMGAH